MKIKNTFLLGIFLLIFISCSENDIITFDGEEGIYFNKRERVGNILTDSTNFTFIYLDEDITESIVSIPVQLVGKEKNVDRPISVNIVGGTAIEGVDFVMPINPVMPANESSFMLEIILKRTLEIKEFEKTIELEIEENDHFKYVITHEVVDALGKEVSALRHKIEFSDQFVMGAAPVAWYTPIYLFTPQRFFLVCKVMDIPRSDFNDVNKISQSRFTYLISETIKYVAEQLMLDNPDPDIFDEKGNPIF